MVAKNGHTPGDGDHRNEITTTEQAEGAVFLMCTMPSCASLKPDPRSEVKTVGPFVVKAQIGKLGAFTGAGKHHQTKHPTTAEVVESPFGVSTAAMIVAGKLHKQAREEENRKLDEEEEKKREFEAEYYYEEELAEFEEDRREAESVAAEEAREAAARQEAATRDKHVMDEVADFFARAD